MSQYARRLNDHYGRPDLIARIEAALRDAGLDPSRLRPAELAAFDEFHVGGREATLDLLAMAELPARSRILDLGCGVGGPARTLAASLPEAEITGMDIVAEYCRVARWLNDLTGLARRIVILERDLRSLDLSPPGYDVVWSQHALMNVPDKVGLIDAISRQYGPAGGVFVFHEAFAGAVAPPVFPVPWANAPDHSSLVPPAAWSQLLAEAGFVARHWRDATEQALNWLDRTVAARRSAEAHARGVLNQGLLMGDDAATKSCNLRRNLAEGRLRLFMGVFDCPA